MAEFKTKEDFAALQAYMDACDYYKEAYLETLKRALAMPEGEADFESYRKLIRTDVETWALREAAGLPRVPKEG